MSDLQALIDALAVSLRPHAASPVEARRKVTDSTPPANVGEGYGKPNTLSSRRRGGRYPNTYRPRAKDFAGMGPVTTRPAYGSVKPANGERITRPAYGNGKPASRDVEAARAAASDNGYRAWVSARGNLARDAGDVLPAGEMYPRKVTRRGNLGPSPRY
jgi:hypothetical protein